LVVFKAEGRTRSLSASCAAAKSSRCP
jgi:hypothetical protein